MTFSPYDWQRRFIQQATWTRDLRQHLYQQANLHLARSVLDVGCGSAALEPELRTAVSGQVVGLDINNNYLGLAKSYAPDCFFIQGDAHHLPFENASFDVSLCHFVLLWLTNPVKALQEMRRVTRRGGCVMILAEPDYSGRLDYPRELAQLGHWQRESLSQQGADPAIGSRLADFCQQAELSEVHGGVLGGQWTAKANPMEMEKEWGVLQDDLAKLRQPPPPHEIDVLRKLDHRSSLNGERVLFVPTFYAWGRKP